MRKHHPDDVKKFLEKEAFKLQKAATNTLKKRCGVYQPLLTSILSHTPYSKVSAKQKRITEKLAIRKAPAFLCRVELA